MYRRIVSWLKDKTYSYRLKKAIRKHNRHSSDYKMMIVDGYVVFVFSRGENNRISIGRGCRICNLKIRMIGNNNILRIGDNVTFGGGNTFNLEGNGTSIEVGNRCSVSCDNNFWAQEDGMSIVLGEHCLLSHGLVFRTSDAHPIFSMDTNERINLPKPVRVGRDVWFAPDSKIYKGAVIGDGSIIGSNTLVTGPVPPNCLAVGQPAKVIKEHVYWTGQKLMKTPDDFVVEP